MDWGGLNGLGRGFFFFFWGGGGDDYVAYQIKADDACSNMVANSLPTDTPSTRGWDQRSSHIFFSESSLVAYLYY